jgi:prophage regulatory protein
MKKLQPRPGRPRKIAPITQTVATQLPQSENQSSVLAQSREGLLRLERIITGDPANGVEPIIPVSRTTWYQGIRDGLFPAPVRLPGIRGSFWRAAEVYNVLAATTASGLA